MRVKAWHKVTKVTLVLSILYTTFAIAPPVVLAGVFVGVSCILANTILLIHIRGLVSQGRGEERRP